MDVKIVKSSMASEFEKECVKLLNEGYAHAGDMIIVNSLPDKVNGAKGRQEYTQQWIKYTY